MTQLDLIALGILVLSLIGIAVIVIRKFPVLASIDLGSTSRRLEERKSTIVEERLKRKFFTLWTRVRESVGPAAKTSMGIWENVHKRLIDLEHEYRVRALPVLLTQRQRRKVDAEVRTIIEQAQALLDDGEYAAAEERALQAIRLDPKSIGAFELLGNLYSATKEYSQAKEVYLYLLQLTGEDETKVEARGQRTGAGAGAQELRRASDLQGSVVSYYFELARTYAAMEDWDLAFESMQVAARAMPYNPKVLDEYIEICIQAGKKGFAEDALAHMKESNPHNSKIADWDERIAALDRTPLLHH